MAKTLRLASPVADKETLDACYVILQRLDSGGPSGGSDETLNGFLDGTLTAIMIPDDVEAIRAGVFQGCYALTDINVSDGHSTMSAAEGVLYNKDKTVILAVPPGKVSGEFIIPDGIIGIADKAFASCLNLEGVDLTPDMEFASENAFIDCSDELEVRLQLNGEILNQGGVYPAENLGAVNTIIIPEDATYVSLDALDNFPNIHTAYINNSVDWELHTEYVNKNVYYYNVFTNNKLPIQKVVFGENCRCIPAYFMNGITSLKVLEFNDNLDEIGEYAFCQCTSLTRLTLPAGTRYGTNAFSGCTGLSDLIISQGVTELAESMFGACDSLTNVVIPSSVATVRSYAFTSCTGLTDVVIEPGATIGMGMFQNCPNLKNVTIGEGLACIPESAFYHCSSLENVAIPNTVTTIDGYAFAYCESLESVIIPEGVDTIQDYAFYFCASLKHITIPRSVTNMNNIAFAGCTDVTIRGYAGSVAEECAQFYGWTFEAIAE